MRRGDVGILMIGVMELLDSPTLCSVESSLGDIEKIDEYVPFPCM